MLFVTILNLLFFYEYQPVYQNYIYFLDLHMLTILFYYKLIHWKHNFILQMR